MLNHGGYGNMGLQDYNITPQLYTDGSTMLELLSPWFPTSPKDTGGLKIEKKDTNHKIQVALY